MTRGGFHDRGGRCEVERRGNAVRSAGSGDSIPSARYPTSALLLASIHREERRAIKELFVLYAPLLRDQARRMSIPPDERDEFVTTLLDDVVRSEERRVGKECR